MPTPSKPRLIKKAGAMAVQAEVSPRAITFESEAGGFALTPTGITIKGKPEFGDWENALNLAVYLEERSSFWKADLLEYGHKRADWAQFIDAVIDADKFTESTVSQYRHISRSVPKVNRVEGVSFSHHAEVASLPSDDQRPYLERAKRDHLSVSALRAVIRKEKPVKRILSGQDSAIAKAYDALVVLAHDAAESCKEIPRQDGAKAEKHLKEARRLLDRCDDAITKWRKAQGS